MINCNKITVRINGKVLPPSEYEFDGKELTINRRLNMDISGYHLQARGWARKGTTYTKDENTITYDGYEWRLNGNVINTINDIP